MRLVTPGDSAPASVNRYLLVHENQVITVRQHPFALLSPAAALAGSLIVAISTPAISYGRHLPVAIVWSLTALLALELFLAIVRWSKAYLVITNHRLLIFSGRSPDNADVLPLEGLKGVTMYQSVSSRLLGYGTLVHEGRPIYHFLPYPQQLFLELQDLLFSSPAREE